MEVGALNEAVRVEFGFVIGDVLIKATAGTGVENRPCQWERQLAACVEESKLPTPMLSKAIAVL